MSNSGGAAGIGLIRQEHGAGGDAGPGTPTALLLPLQGHLGTSLGAVDASGRVVEAIGHDAFGQRTDGTVATQSHRFAGEYWDEDAQLVYLRARWYDPRLGRFISGDPVEGRQGDPRSLNRYVYAHGDPVHSADRSGLMGMMDVGVSLNINAINASAAAVGIGAAALLSPHADNAVRTSLWHVMMYGRISHHVPQEAIEEMDKAEQKAKNKSHKPEERHHTDLAPGFRIP